MSIEDRNQLNRIEELKRKLTSRNFHREADHRDILTPSDKKDVPSSWEIPKEAMRDFGAKFFLPTSIFKKFFYISLIFFLLAAGYASYKFFALGNTVSNNNIDIFILGNAFTAGGEELPMQISIANRNASPLELVDLVVEYPRSSEATISVDLERIRVPLGTIPAGGIRNEIIKLILFGEQGSVRPLRVSIEYRVEGSNAIFIKEKFHEVNIASTPIDLSADLPLSISPNQDLMLKIQAIHNSARLTSNILLRVDYPVGFQFNKASPAPTFGNNIWALGDLAPGAEKQISIEGKMFDVFDGEEKTFRVWSGAQAPNDKFNIGIVFNSLARTVLIQRPAIEARLFVNGSSAREYASSSSLPINAEIRWANNLETKISDLEIRAEIKGNVINRKTIFSTQGFYNSLIDTIVWNKNSISGFREVAPGDAGVVTFSLSPLPIFAVGELLSEPHINIALSVSGRRALEGFEPVDLTSRESSTIRIISDVGLAGKVLYYSGPFVNSGPIPPKVAETTTYTIVWSLSNTANTVSKAIVRAALPPWVSFSGNFSPVSENLSFNSLTKEIIWNVGTLPKGAGITGPGKEVAFTISFTPSLSQVGTAPTLINDAVLTGHDEFANVDLRVNKASLSTRLVNDPQFPALGERVVE